MTELWKGIPGYRYEVSNLGRVRSLDRLTLRRHGQYKRKWWKYRGRVLRPGIYKKYGYPIVVLRRMSKSRTFNVHQLVADAFLPKPTMARVEINHIDGNKSNPAVTNLEWITHSENAHHSIDFGLRKTFVITNHRTHRKVIYTNARTL